MSTGTDYVAAKHLQYARATLAIAARYVAVHAPTPLWKKKVGRRDAALLYRIERDGSLAVYREETGQLLALSEPGRHDVLRPDFKPTPPETR